MDISTREEENRDLWEREETMRKWEKRGWDGIKAYRETLKGGVGHREGKIHVYDKRELEMMEKKWRGKGEQIEREENRRDVGVGGGRDRNVKMLGRDITLEQAQEGVGDGM